MSVIMEPLKWQEFFSSGIREKFSRTPYGEVLKEFVSYFNDSVVHNFLHTENDSLNISLDQILSNEIMFISLDNCLDKVYPNLDISNLSFDKIILTFFQAVNSNPKEAIYRQNFILKSKKYIYSFIIQYLLYKLFNELEIYQGIEAEFYRRRG